MKLADLEAVLVALVNMRSSVINDKTSIDDPAEKRGAALLVGMLTVDLMCLPTVKAAREQELSIIQQNKEAR
jgi:ABC-type phosphate transport system permease subunit